MVSTTGIPHYNDCNTLSRQSSRLLHRRCLWSSAITISRPDGTAYCNAEFAIWQTSSIDCTFSFHCKSAAIRQSSPFDSQSALADKINRFLTEQADRLDKGCGCRFIGAFSNSAHTLDSMQLSERLFVLAACILASTVTMNYRSTLYIKILVCLRYRFYT